MSRFEFTDLPDGLCPVAPSERRECGYYGITKDECLRKSCCWDPTVPNTKWCFKQPSEYTRKASLSVGDNLQTAFLMRSCRTQRFNAGHPMIVYNFQVQTFLPFVTFVLYRTDLRLQ